MIQHFDGGHWIPMTSPTHESLRGVWGNSDASVFAVGTRGTILHYNGSSWGPMASGTTRSLAGVWGTSGSDLFAVGENATVVRYGMWGPLVAPGPGCSSGTVSRGPCDRCSAEA